MSMPSAPIQAVHTCLCDAGISVRTQLSLAACTTFRIGGNAALAAYPETAKEVRLILNACRAHDVRCAVIGNGSNLLCPDEGFDGCVLFTSAMKEIVFDGNIVTVGAGASLTAVCCAARDRGLAGLTFAYGIPGSVGGGVFMNAGAYGGELGDRILDVTYLSAATGEIVTYAGADCGFGYRTSRFCGSSDIILSARFLLEAGDADAIRAEMESISAARREKQPLEYPSAGSAFKRYPGRYTAQMIDEAGLKGYSVGGAQVSEKHAGFIINRGGATCEDVVSLIGHIRMRIGDLYDIDIEPEIRMIDDCIVM